MIKQTYHFDELKCHDCAHEIVEKVESIEYIRNVYIDYDNNDITIESDKIITKEEVDDIVKEIVRTDHETKHLNLFKNIKDIITEEFLFEDIDCPNCASNVEELLNKNEDIIEARVNFLNKKVIIKHKNNVEIYNIASKILDYTEPGARLIKDEDEHHHDEEHEHHHEHHHHEDEHCHGECEVHEKHNVNLSRDDHKNHVIISTFDFEDIDCANCALKVERALNKEEDIIDASVNFIAKKISVKHKDDVDALSIVEKVLKNTEPDAYLVLDNKRKDKKSVLKTIILFIGIALFVCGLVIMHLGDEEIIENLSLDKPFIADPLYTILLYITFVPAYFCVAYDIIYKSFIGIIHKDIFNESFLMLVASLGALCLSFFGENEFVESCAVILLYKLGEHLQSRATDKSKRAIKELIEMKKDSVTLKDGTIKSVKEVKIGEIITIKAGELVPLDGIISSGETNIDKKALTGESMPIYANVGEEILSGSINLTRVIDVEVTKVDEESTMSKVLKLVEDASNQKSKSEEFITKFARIYTPVILLFALIVLIVEIITGFGIPAGMGRVSGALTNMFSILVISCPCALVISIPLGYFAGIGRFSKSGILVKGGNYVEALANADTFVFDKTGTITKGNFKVSKIYTANNVSKEEVLRIVATCEQFSMHPIANAINEAYNRQRKVLENASVEEFGGAGIKVCVNDKVALIGNENLMNKFNIKFEKNNEVGTVLYLAVNDVYYGCILLKDEIKKEAYDLFAYLNKKNKRSIMLSGDNEDVCKAVCDELSINEYKAKILPQDKYNYIDNIIKENDKKTVYIGDGINDAPSLRRADVGIAMGGIGSDSAKQCADVIIMKDDILKVKDAIEISKYTKKIILENIIIALGFKLIALVVSMLGILSSFAMIVALFADVGVCIIDILNVLRILKFKNKKKH
ncbi:MAG: cadmium-translocating P-type ATPase [Bacilli bacterium]|nr:cadmium-translocating P-type ATPase [Bacilli bacterium]